MGKGKYQRQPGDILLVSLNKKIYGKNSPMRSRLSEGLFRDLTTRVQGQFTHAGMVAGDGSDIIEARIGEGVQRRSLREAVGDKDYLILRARRSKKQRERAALHAESQVGRSYSTRNLILTGAGTVLPTPARRALSRVLPGSLTDKKKGVQCADLVVSAYSSSGQGLRLAEKAEMAAPISLLNSRDTSVVDFKLKGPAAVASLGRYRGKGKGKLRKAGIKLAAMRLSKRGRKDLERSDTHFSAPEKNWDAFLGHAKRRTFARAVAADPRADGKLQRHVDQMHRLQMGRVIASAPGSKGKSYNIVRKRGGGLGCTCDDWRYRRSVSPDGAQECKHIRTFRQGQGTSMRAKRMSVLAERGALTQSSSKVAGREGAAIGAAIGGLHGLATAGKPKTASIRDALTGANIRKAREALRATTDEHEQAARFLAHIKGKAARGGQAMGGHGSRAQRQARRVAALGDAVGAAQKNVGKEMLRTGAHHAAWAVPTAAGLYALKKRRDAKK